MLAKGRVIEVRKGKAIVEIGNKRKTVELRSDIKVKKGDEVFVTLGTIVDKA